MNSEAYNKLTKGERFIADWQLGHHGNFMKALRVAMDCADMENLSRLALGFPEEAQAYNRFSTQQGWWEDLAKKLEIPA